MNKPPVVVEIPKNASDQVTRLQVEEVKKSIEKARAGRQDRVRVIIQQGD